MQHKARSFEIAVKKRANYETIRSKKAKRMSASLFVLRITIKTGTELTLPFWGTYW